MRTAGWISLCCSIACANAPGAANPEAAAPSDPCLEQARSPDDDETGRALATALLASPDDPSAHRALAQYLGDAGEVEPSIAQYRCALDLDPALEDVRIELAGQLVGLGKYSEAKVELEQVLASHSPDFRIRSLLATALEGLGDLGAAADQMERAAEETKSSAVLFRRAAELWHRFGDDQRSAVLKARADELDPPPERRNMRPLVKARPPKRKK